MSGTAPDFLEHSNYFVLSSTNIFLFLPFLVFCGSVSAVCTPHSGAQPVENHKQTSLEQDPPKRAAEILVEDGVNDWIEGRVHVAEPEGGGEGLVRYVAPGANRCQDIKEEEGKPACDERPHDQPQN